MHAPAGLDVRDALAEEHGAVVALRLAAYEEHLRALPDDIALPYRAELGDAQTGAAAGRLIVAADGGTIVGAVLFMPDAAADSHPAPPRSAAVRLLAVAPDLRGQGIGEVLVRHCVREAGAGRSEHVVLHTAPFMRDAIRLYVRLGFTRAPAYDFDPHTHYAGHRPDPGAGDVQGLAYSLRVPRHE